jgi:hypothetical protein
MLTLEYSRKIINGEIVEANIINLFGFIFKDNIFEWDENFAQDHPSYTLKNWNKALVNNFKLRRMTRKSIYNYETFNVKLLNKWRFTMNSY